MDLHKAAEALNILGEFCGIRDIEELSKQRLLEKYHFSKVDLLILFGGSILHGCDIAGNAVMQKIAKTFMIVGGEGHTTESLRRSIKNAYPQIHTEGKMEADVMREYLQLRYGITDCLIERNSTNCGNNVTYALEVMKQNEIEPESIIIIQDAAMQCRMKAGFLKYLQGENVNIINFAAYRAEIIVKDGKLLFDKPDISGMWDMERYVSLLMGEIPRLMDNEGGYGPKGKDYIAHVEIPEKVYGAFKYLKNEYGNMIREANTQYASKQRKVMLNRNE